MIRLVWIAILGIVGVTTAPVEPALGASSAKNEAAVSRTTFTVENQDFEGACPPGPLVQSVPSEGRYGEYRLPHSCPWSVSVKQRGRLVWQRVFSAEGDVVAAVGAEEEIEGDTEGSFGVARYPWSCAHTGKMQWETTVWDDLGSGWSESAIGQLRVPPCVPVHRVGESRRKAENAVQARLAGEYVSRLRCQRRNRGWRCAVVYNNTFRICTAVFRVDFYSSTEFGERTQESQIQRRKRRCAYF